MSEFSGNTLLYGPKGYDPCDYNERFKNLKPELIKCDCCFDEFEEKDLTPVTVSDAYKAYRKKEKFFYCKDCIKLEDENN